MVDKKAKMVKAVPTEDLFIGKTKYPAGEVASFTEEQADRLDALEKDIPKGKRLASEWKGKMNKMLKKPTKKRA